MPSIDRSPSGKEHQHFFQAQAGRGRLHGADQVRVRIDRHDVGRARQPPRQRRLEVLRRADEEQLPERPKGSAAPSTNAVEIRLVIGGDDDTGPCAADVPGPSRPTRTERGDHEQPTPSST